MATTFYAGQSDYIAKLNELWDGDNLNSNGLTTTLALPGATRTAGTGVAFPATQLPSTNANTLDDYEEGTTPALTVAGTTAAGVGTYTRQVMRYTKVGNLVTVSFGLIWTALTGATGNLSIAGLPFTSDSLANMYPISAIASENLVYTGTLMGYVAPSSTSIILQSYAPNVAAVPVAIDTAGSLFGTIQYYTA